MMENGEAGVFNDKRHEPIRNQAEHIHRGGKFTTHCCYTSSAVLREQKESKKRCGHGDTEPEIRRRTAAKKREYTANLFKTIIDCSKKRQHSLRMTCCWFSSLYIVIEHLPKAHTGSRILMSFELLDLCPNEQQLLIAITSVKRNNDLP